MKIIITSMLVALICVSHAFGQIGITINDKILSPQEFVEALKSVRDFERAFSGNAVIKKIDEALLEIHQKGSLKGAAMERLSQVLWGEYRLLKFAGHSSEPITFTMRSVFNFTCMEIKGHVDYMAISDKEMNSLVDAAGDLRVFARSSVANVLPDLRRISSLTLTALVSDDPAVALNASEIHFLWKSVDSIRTVGWVQGARAIEIALARVAGRLEMKK